MRRPSHLLVALALASAAHPAAGNDAADDYTIPPPPPPSQKAQQRPHVWVNQSNVLREEDAGTHVGIAAFGPDNRFGFGDKIAWAGTLEPATYFDIEFELTSDDVQALELVLLVANGRQEHVALTLRSSQDPAASSGANSVEVTTGCEFVWRDCVRQRYFQYTLPPYVEKGSLYQGQLSLRAHSAHAFWPEPLKGKWTLTIRNYLPDHAHVKLMVFQASYTYREMALKGAALVFLFICLCLVAGDYVNWRVNNERIIRPTDDTNTTAALSWDARVARAFTSLDRSLRGLEDSLRSSRDSVCRSVQDRYSRLNNPADRSAAAAASDSEPPGCPADAEAASSVPAGEEEEEDEDEDEEHCCRICKETQPRDGLFSPCDCRGSMKYVHRDCLEEWRVKTTSEENRRRCGECRTPFTVVETQRSGRVEYAILVIRGLVWTLCILFLVECSVLAAGFGFKAVAGTLTWDLENIVWQANLYHHIVGMVLICTTFVHYTALQPTFEQTTLSPLSQAAVIFASLFLEAATGYVGEFVMWLGSSTLWDWQVRYCTGAFVSFVYIFCVHNMVVRSFNRWKLERRVEHVVSAADLEGHPAGYEASPRSSDDDAVVEAATADDAADAPPLSSDEPPPQQQQPPSSDAPAVAVAVDVAATAEEEEVEVEASVPAPRRVSANPLLRLGASDPTAYAEVGDADEDEDEDEDEEVVGGGDSGGTAALSRPPALD